MNSERHGSAPTSATMSSSAPAKPDDMSPEQFLAHQQEQARRAIARIWGQITSGLKEGADPAAWAREYPWTALGTAAAAGFVAAAAVVPTKEQQALKKLAALERALQPAAPPVGDGFPSDKAPPAHSPLVGFMLEAIKSLQPVLVSLITAKVAAPQPQNGDDAHPDEPPPPAGPS